MSIEQGPRQDRETGVNPADLPPIDNVAVPPLKHDADLNSSKHWQGVQETYHGPAIRPAPEQTDDVLTGRKTPDEVQGEVAQDRRLGSLPRVLGVGTAAALLTIVAKFGFDAANNDDKKVPVANKPVASAPVDPTPTETAPTQEAESLPDVKIATIEDYTLEEAGKYLYSLSSESVMHNWEAKDRYDYAMYGLTTAEWQDNGDRRWDLIENRDYARTKIDEANKKLSDASVTGTDGKLLQYWFKQSMGERVRTEGNTIYFKSVIESNHADMPAYQPDLGPEFAYEFAADLPSEDSRQDITEFITLDQIDGRWVIVDEGYEEDR